MGEAREQLEDVLFGYAWLQHHLNPEAETALQDYSSRLRSHLTRKVIGEHREAYEQELGRLSATLLGDVKRGSEESVMKYNLGVLYRELEAANASLDNFCARLNGRRVDYPTTLEDARRLGAAEVIGGTNHLLETYGRITEKLEALD